MNLKNVLWNADMTLPELFSVRKAYLKYDNVKLNSLLGSSSHAMTALKQ